MAMLRATPSKVVLRAVRAISSGRSVCGSITTAFNGCDQVPLPISHHFSTDTDDVIYAKKQGDRQLSKILKSDIKLQKMFLDRGMPIIPSDFPFTIKDDTNGIILTRDFDGEKIEVVVDMPDKVAEDESDWDSDISSADDDVSSSDEEKEEKEEKEPLSLRVVISKNGRISKFEVSATVDKIKVDSFLLKCPIEAESDETSESDETLTSESVEMLTFGPHKVEEEGDLQVGLGEFLKIRGIDKDYYGFLYKYMAHKCRIRPVVVMKKLRTFIAD